MPFTSWPCWERLVRRNPRNAVHQLAVLVVRMVRIDPLDQVHARSRDHRHLRLGDTPSSLEPQRDGDRTEQHQSEQSHADHRRALQFEPAEGDRHGGAQCVRPDGEVAPVPLGRFSGPDPEAQSEHRRQAVEDRVALESTERFPPVPGAGAHDRESRQHGADSTFPPVATTESVGSPEVSRFAAPRVTTLRPLALTGERRNLATCELSW